MAHIFAVSGLHIGFLAAAILFLLKKLRVNNYVSAAVLAAVFVIYGIMTGMPSGVKRAAITFIVFLLAKNSVRKSDPLTSLAFSAVIIILTNPRELFDVGFIMSYGAVFGIIAFYKPFFDILKKISGNKVYRYFAKILATTMSANIFVLPVSFNVFNTGSGIFRNRKSDYSAACFGRFRFICRRRGADSRLFGIRRGFCRNTLSGDTVKSFIETHLLSALFYRRGRRAGGSRRFSIFSRSPFWQNTYFCPIKFVFRFSRLSARRRFYVSRFCKRIKTRVLHTLFPR
jgi:ComEC/Rec2-related protein